MIDRYPTAQCVPEINLDDPDTWPIPGTVWQHTNGNVYRVYLFTNVQPERQDRYPTTIVYQNVENMEMYSRKLVDWERSMTLLALDKWPVGWHKPPSGVDDV